MSGWDWMRWLSYTAVTPRASLQSDANKMIAWQWTGTSRHLAEAKSGQFLLHRISGAGSKVLDGRRQPRWDDDVLTSLFQHHYPHHPQHGEEDRSKVQGRSVTTLCVISSARCTLQCASYTALQIFHLMLQYEDWNVSRSQYSTLLHYISMRSGMINSLVSSDSKLHF